MGGQAIQQRRRITRPSRVTNGHLSHANEALSSSLRWHVVAGRVLACCAPVVRSAAIADRSRRTIPGKASRPHTKAGFENPDGTFSILFGYYNRNLKQESGYPSRAG